MAGQELLPIYVEGKTVFLLSIYDKSEQADISDKQIELLLKGLHS